MVAMEAGAMPQGTAPPSPTHPSAPPIRSSSPSASIPSLEQPVSDEIRVEPSAFGEFHGEQPVSGENSEEQGGNDVQQKKSREKRSGHVEQRDGSRVPKSLPSSKKIGSSSASKKIVESVSRKTLKFADLFYVIRLLGGFKRHQKIEKSSNLIHSIPLPGGFQKLQPMGRADATDVADAADLVVGRSGAAPNPMAASSASVKGGAKKDTTSPAEGVSLHAIGLVLTVVVAVVIPILLLVRFDGHPMSQVWILSLSICSYVFFFLLFIWRSWWFYTDFFRLSYAPLLAFLSAIAIGSAIATFVLLFSMVWAAGNLGYSLAVHRLRMGTESAIHVVPKTFCPTRDSVKNFTFCLYRGAPFVVLLWTLFIALCLNVATVTDELDILLVFSYFGWIHVAAWLIIVHLGPMHGFPLEEPMEWLVPALPAGVLFSPAIAIVSQILSVLCNLLLMLALVAFLWYNLAVYIHFLATATPSTTTRGNEDTLCTKILEDKIGQV